MSTESLSAPVALVTGADKGIGLETARRQRRCERDRERHQRHLLNPAPGSMRRGANQTGGESLAGLTGARLYSK
jgi:hypothetical protein